MVTLVSWELESKVFDTMYRASMLMIFHVVSSPTLMLHTLEPVVDPNANPAYGLVEVKCCDVKDTGQGQAKLKKIHTYHWQVSTCTSFIYTPTISHTWS